MVLQRSQVEHLETAAEDTERRSAEARRAATAAKRGPRGLIGIDGDRIQYQDHIIIGYHMLSSIFIHIYLYI